MGSSGSNLIANSAKKFVRKQRDLFDEDGSIKIESAVETNKGWLDIKDLEAAQEEEAHLEAICPNEAFVPKIRALDDGK